MAFNQTYNNDKKNNERELFGDIRFYHAEAEVDPGMLGISFWNGMIKLSISPLDKSSLNGSTPKYDHENKGFIFLRPFEAYMLSQEIKNVIAGQPQLNAGVQNMKRDATVFICSGMEFGVATPCLAIRKIDENGNIPSTYVYQFRTDNNVIRNFDVDTKDFEKYFYDNLELIMLQQTLEDFARTMNGSMAYSIQHYGRFDTSRVSTKLDSIAEKLGITYPNSGNRNSGMSRQSSIFDNKESRQTHFDTVDPEDFEL